MKPGFTRFVPVACLLCSIEMSAVAHERHFHQTDDGRPSPEECQVDLERRGGIDQGRGLAERDAGVIARCKGVLIPPLTGDAEMVEPAPEVGTTPVIPPDSVPEQLSGPDYP